MTALRAIVTIGIAALWLALFVPPMFMEPPSAVTGVHFVDDGSLFPPNRVRVDRGSPGYRAGLRTGDVLQCLSVRDYNLLFATAGPQGYTPGSPISTCVRRGNAWKHITFVAAVGPPVPNTYGSAASAALRVFVVLIFYLTGIALVTLRPGLSTWVFFAYAIADAPSFQVQIAGTVYPAPLYALALGLTNFSAFTATAYILLFAVAVPDDRVPSGWRRIAFFAAAALACADMAFAAWTSVETTVGLSFIANYFLDHALSALTILLVVARLITMKRSERARFGWAAFAIIVGVIANDLRNVLSYENTYPLIATVCADLTVVMPICLLYGILKRHVIDVRFAMSRTVVFAALTTLVVGVIGLVDWATSAYLHEVRVAMAIDALVTVGLAFAMHRAYYVIEKTVDLVLFRYKHEAQTYLSRMGKTLLRAKSEATIDAALVDAPYEKFDLTMAALFRVNGDSFVPAATAGGGDGATAFDCDHELVRFLATERTKLQIGELRKHVAANFHEHGAAPAVAIPLFQSDQLVAFAIYGIHRDGTKLDPDEIDTLERLCDTAAQAYTAIELSRYRTLTQAMPAVEAIV